MQVNDIFYSIQGEGLYAGQPAVFLRMQGCHNRCEFCDTKFARNPTKGMTISEVAVFNKLLELVPKERRVQERHHVRTLCGRKFANRPCHLVITGGEPLDQREELFDLIERCRSSFRKIEVETSGEPDWGPIGGFLKTCRNAMFTFSPKSPECANAAVKLLCSANETIRNKVVIKVVNSDNMIGCVDRLLHQQQRPHHSMPHGRLFAQPVWDDAHPLEFNLARAAVLAEWVQQHPYWRLSVQLHKLLQLK